jgi:hypothetical protein
MVKLPESKVKNGYLYKLLKRTNNTALYEQIVDKDCNGTIGKTVGYEVFKISITKEYSITQKSGKKKGEVYFYPESEKFPGNEDGGKTLFSYDSKEKALKKFKELELIKDKA